MVHIRRESPELLFTGELMEALHAERVELSEGAQQYLVRLLSDSGHRQHRPLQGNLIGPSLLRAAQRKDGRIQRRQLRHVGDTALLLSGWWWRFTETARHGPGLDYHVDVGWSAYRLIDDEPFEELAKKFIRLVNVLAQMTIRVRESGGRVLISDVDDEVVLDLYEYWCRTGSPQAKRLLKLNGFNVSSSFQ